MVIHEISNEKVIYSDENNTMDTIPEAEFLRIWSWVALHAEVTESSGEDGYKQNRFNVFLRSLRLPLTVLLLSMILYFSFQDNAITLWLALVVLLKFIGLVVSMVLLYLGFNSDNPLVKNLCKIGGENDCNNILKSDAASVNSWLSWSEVGFFYFAGSFLSLVLFPSSLLFLACLSLLAMPYTVFSISYQYRNKNWCVLCCVVQVILISEVLLSLMSSAFHPLIAGSIGDVFTLNTEMGIGIAFLMPILLWSFLKPVLSDASQISSLKWKLKKYKYDRNLFQKALVDQPRYIVPNQLMPVIIGNPDAKKTITMISNPFCDPCGKAHQTLSQWIKTRDDLKLEVMFTTTHSEDENTKISKHVTSLSLLRDAKLLEEALDDWYNQRDKNYFEWSKRYPISINEEAEKVMHEQRVWCESAKIIITPTIFIDGQRLPDPYVIEDMKYMLS